MTDLYKILGLTEDCSSDEIKKAYKKLSQKYHPDKNDNSEESKEKFQAIKESYEVLKDPERRHKYDQFGDTEHKIDNTETLIINELSDMFLKIFIKNDFSKNVDYKSTISKNMQAEEAGIDSKNIELEIHIVKLEKLKGVMTSKKEDNIFDIFLEGRIDSLRKVCSDLKARKDFLISCFKFLDDYENIETTKETKIFVDPNFPGVDFSKLKTRFV